MLDFHRDEPLRHNYMKKLVLLHERGGLPEGLAHVEVRHDDACPALRPRPGYCTCDPDVLVEGHPDGDGSPRAQRRRERRARRRNKKRR